MFTPVFIIAGIFAALLLILIIFIATRPADFVVRRSTVVAAPASVPFALVNDFHRWVSWSPWEKLDPAMKKTFTGSPAGVGAVYTWAGNKKAGEGRMTILESRPNESIRIKLEFIKPFTATNTADFVFKPEGDRTAITWSMSGTRSFMFKAFALFMDMEKLVGPDFERGLASIKSLSESRQTESVA